MQTDEQQPDYITEQQEALYMLGRGYNTDSIPPKKFTSTISGFTPAPDVLIKQYGYVTALVWGRTWRYCQMSDGVCRASIGKIGAGLGMSERTIIRHLEGLCQGGYLLDTTPDLRNKPHIYADTGKIKIGVSVEAAMTESHSRVTESHSRYDRESVEDSIKKPTKKQKKQSSTTRPDFRSLQPSDYRKIPELKTFIDATGWIPGSFVLETIFDSIRDHGLTEEKIKSAFKAWTARSYKPGNVEGYLTWARDGIPPAYSSNKQTQTKPTEPKGFDAVRKFLANHQEEAFTNG